MSGRYYVGYSNYLPSCGGCGCFTLLAILVFLMIASGGC
jgi:hypothetical protein